MNSQHAAPDGGKLRPTAADSSSPPEAAAAQRDIVPRGKLTIRALLTGAALAALLSVANLYLALQAGIVVNMSITAALLGFAFWTPLHRLSRGRVEAFDLHENNLNQTACSAGALISSAGLAAHIPALTLVTGHTWSWPTLFVWLLGVCCIGITIATLLRRRMVEDEGLAFPVGTASAELLRELHERSRQAMRRVWALVTAAVIAAGVAAAGFGAILFGVQISGFSAGSLTLLLRPSLFPLAIGGLVGFRAGLSLLIGSVVAYGVLAPALLREGVIPLTARVSLEVWPTDVELPVRSAHGGGAYSTATGMLTWQGVMPEAERDRLLARSRDAEFATAVELLYDRSRAVLDPARAVEGAPQPSFGVLLQWLVWPGTALMVAAALTKLVLSWRTFLGWTDSHRVRGAGRSRPDRPTSWGIRIALGLVILISMGLQVALFEIPWWAALLATALALMLALVAARVSGETGVTPTGQMAKISQLTFGALLPATPAANLMAANVSAGAASQSADLLDDLKAGHLVGTPPRWQTIAQIVGVLTGAAVCAAVFVVVFGQTPERLLTEEWPAPAVAVVAAVAELFAQGGAVLPPGAALAMGIAAAVGVALTILEELAPGRWKPWMLSGASLGLAFVIPGYLALGIFLGSLIALVVQRVAARWSGEYFIAICAGAIAGDSLFSVGQRVWLMRERIGSVLFGG